MSTSTFTYSSSSHIKDIADLDPVLQPVWRHYTDEELQRFEDLPPFDELPLPFISDRRQRPRPPLMYFGWRIDADKWFDYAKLNNLTVTVRIMHFEGEDDPDFSENDEDDTPETIVEEISKYHSVAHVFWSFIWELGITPYTDNYKDNSTLTQDRLKKLQDMLGEPGPPGWYASNHFHWTYPSR